MFPNDDDNPFSKLYDKLGYKKPEKEPVKNVPPQQDNRKYTGSNSTTNLPRFCVPKDTLECIEQMGNQVVENFHLKLNRLVFTYEDKIGNLSSKVSQPDKNNRTRQEVIPSHKTGRKIAEIGKIANRIWHIAAKTTTQTQKIVMQPQWRFASGLGGESVYETGITLHHVYGIPYIPASSVKGVVRSWVILNKFGNKEEDAIRDEWFIDLFGCPDQIANDRGKFKSKYDREEKDRKDDNDPDKKNVGIMRKGNIVFFDAFPTKEQTIEADIMNPHYPEYYAGKKPPTDFQNPIPVLFLTVAKTPFQFVFGYQKATEHTAFENGEKMMQVIGQYLKEALTQHGIGAKTAVGYGYMQ
ncbi:MAG: type III-B CRISPR module RAMP protein Cmr6 [Sphingobacteriales bacterium]|nr:type III-B CRISPR module RAMP protein Cmr6 [Sphingobacteriales bacterium]